MSELDVDSKGIRLYSPPQFNGRFPKHEPAPQKAKSMTIAAGFRCRDGVVLLVDSQHSTSNMKYPGDKLWNLESQDGSKVVVTGAGDDAAILQAVDLIRDGLGTFLKPLVIADIENIARESKPGLETTLLLGIRLTAEKQARLARVQEDAQGNVRVNHFLPNSNDPCTFIGTEVAEALCRETFDYFYSSWIPTLQMREIGKQLLTHICEYAQWCWPPIQSECLIDEGGQPEGLNDFRVPDGYLSESQDLFAHAVRNALDYS